MIRLFTATALAVLPVAVSAQTAAPPPRLDLQQRMVVRCSAAFALVAFAQEQGNADGTRYPALSERGREFFVRAMAQLMDQTGMSRPEIEAALSAEAQDLVAHGTLHEVMPVCLDLLPPEQ